jgi:hypothetical protein
MQYGGTQRPLAQSAVLVGPRLPPSRGYFFDRRGSDFSNQFELDCLCDPRRAGSQQRACEALREIAPLIVRQELGEQELLTV